jgi:hypothetical protein
MPPLDLCDTALLFDSDSQIRTLWEDEGNAVVRGKHVVDCVKHTDEKEEEYLEGEVFVVVAAVVVVVEGVDHVDDVDAVEETEDDLDDVNAAIANAFRVSA